MIVDMLELITIMFLFALHFINRKRIARLEQSDLYHHTKVTFIPTECDNIREHNKKEFNKEK